MSDPAYARLEASGRFTVERIPDGSNIVKLRLTSGGAEALKSFRGRAEAAGLKMADIAGDAQPIRVNETWLATTGNEIADRLIQAAG